MGIQPRSVSLVRFADFEFDLRTGQLRRGGDLLKLQQQPAKLLAILLSRHGEVISRQELAHAVWKADTFVDFEQGLNFAIRQIRSTLGDDAEQPRFLQTLPKQGYRFIAPVESASQDGESPSISPVTSGEAGIDATAAQTHFRPKGAVIAFISSLIIIVTVVLAVEYGGPRAARANKGAEAGIQSIAVLPLVNLSSDPAQEYFSDGLTDELITKLARIGSLRVISRTSIAGYKHSVKNAPEIGIELHVDSIVEGTVERDRDRVRIRVQVIRTSTDEHLWAETYDGDIKNVLQLESDVAQEIAQQIGYVTSAQTRRVSGERPVSTEAHEAYLKGRFYWNKRTDEGFQRAITYFEQAIRDDSNYAQAYAGLADSYVLLGYYSALAPEEAYPRAKAAAKKALELDPTLGEAHTSLAGALQDYDWNWPEVEQQHKQGVELSPGYATAHQWYGNYLDMMGRFQDAQIQIRQARELDPLSLVINCNLAWSYHLARDDDRALEEFAKIKEMDPNFYWTYLGLGRVYVQKKMYTNAISSMERAAELSGNNTMVLSELAHAYAISGRRGDAEQILARLQRGSQKRYVSAYDVGLVHVGLGQTVEALRWFEKAYRDHCRSLQFSGVEPRLDPLRNNAQFKDLLKRLNLPPGTSRMPVLKVGTPGSTENAS
jgi:TolB-like protein/DNA-binding winged helix-turn-helix (wHTH) protein/Tfp pilus assembly protein PilF